MYSELLSISDLQKKFGLSRRVSRQLALALPHITVGYKGRGQQVKVVGTHAQLFIEYIAIRKVDIMEFIKTLDDGLIAEIISRSKEISQAEATAERSNED